MNERFEVNRQFNQMIGETTTDEPTRDELRQKLEELRNQPTPIVQPANPFDVISYDLDEEGLPTANNQ